MRVERKDGSFTNVVGDEDSKEFKEAVKLAKDEDPRVKFDINVPVQEGHDLVVVHPDGSTTLEDHVPDDALNFVEGTEQKYNKMVTMGGTTANGEHAKAAALDQAKELNSDLNDSGEVKADANKK